jgi:LacI family transcriptional regulator
MTNIKDVAKLAGVSPITVSRYMNNSGYCSLETHTRVKNAIEELGYVPNRLASGLRSKRSNTLALVLTDITNPFFTTIARGVEDVASQAGYTVIFCNTDESPSKEKMYVNMLLERRVDGILLVPALRGVDSIALIKKQGIPIVLLDRRAPDLQTDVVLCDSEFGAYELTRLLLSLGHRKIAILNGPPGVSTSEDRFSGYRKALEEAEIIPDQRLEYFGAFNQESGFEMTFRVMAGALKPTAIFATNNFIAIGVLKALQELGLRVPADVAVVGFDDLPPDLITFPFLTVAAQPAYEIGRRATEILLKKFGRHDPDPYQEVVLTAKIVVRQSTGEIRKLVQK